MAPSPYDTTEQRVANLENDVKHLTGLINQLMEFIPDHFFNKNKKVYTSAITHQLDDGREVDLWTFLTK